MDGASKFSKAGEVLLITCACTLAAENACLLLHEHHPFVEFEKNTACFQHDLTSLVILYAMQFLSPDSNIAGSEKGFEPSEVLVSEIAAITSK